MTNAVATLPAFILSQEIAGGKIARLDVIDWTFGTRTIPGVAVWPNQRPNPRAARQFASNIQMVLQQAVRDFRAKAGSRTGAA